MRAFDEVAARRNLAEVGDLRLHGLRHCAPPVFETAAAAVAGRAAGEAGAAAGAVPAVPVGPGAPAAVALTEFAAALTSATDDGSRKPRRLCCCGASLLALPEACEVLMMRMLTATVTLPCVHDRSKVPSG